MNILADENVEGEVVRALRSSGHEVRYVAEMRRGISDEKVLAMARARGELIITNDKDFGELIFRQGLDHGGVLLLRLDDLTPDEMAELVSGVLHKQSGRLLRGFSVLDSERLRVRAMVDLPVA